MTTTYSECVSVALVIWFYDIFPHYLINGTTFKNKNTQISNSTNIYPVGAKLFHADGQTDITKLIVTFHNFVNTP